MKALVFSDLQAHTHRAYSRPLAGGSNSRLEIALNILDQISKECQERELRRVFFLGDLFEAKNKIPVVVMNRVFERIERMVKEANLIGFYMIPGNHDFAVRNGLCSCNADIGEN